MREIRFRQWNQRRKSFQYGIGANKDCWTSPEYVTWEKYPLMQFSGLLDKNGKEIWEGDIWKWVGGLIEEIKWDADMCCFNIDKSSWGEVIGSIYENPELLKEKP